MKQRMMDGYREMNRHATLSSYNAILLQVQLFPRRCVAGRKMAQIAW